MPPTPAGPTDGPPLLGGWVRTEDGPDGRPWRVRSVSGTAASKSYRCPGCDQELRPGTPHVVAWPEDDGEERRHWHTGCWQRGR